MGDDESVWGGVRGEGEKKSARGCGVFGRDGLGVLFAHEEDISVGYELD